MKVFDKCVGMSQVLVNYIHGSAQACTNVEILED